ncbi:MAG: hypothetical protein KGP28_07295 [Bdellovibrionales bacterium]|nr:hypothetical protein [Bdellovibrionales bacterium]
MEETDYTPIAILAIQFLHTVLFGTAAWEKIKGRKVPEWFLKSFEPTFLSRLPGGSQAQFWVIAGIESILALSFPLSVVVPELLPYALLTSLFLYGILCFGLRLIGDFQGSANMFIYFAASSYSLSIFF